MAFRFAGSAMAQSIGKSPNESTTIYSELCSKTRSVELSRRATIADANRLSGLTLRRFFALMSLPVHVATNSGRRRHPLQSRQNFARLCLCECTRGQHSDIDPGAHDAPRGMTWRRQEQVTKLVRHHIAEDAGNTLR